nr:uncharacterized protein LOC124816678 [Hydra vulgaris]
MSKYEEHISEVYNVREEELKHKIPHTKIIDKSKCDDLDKLTAEIKEKLIVSDQKTKIQLLTFTPESWSRNFAARYFNVTIYQIKDIDQILNCNKMFDYCTNNIKGIIFFKIEKERLTELRTTLKTRFELSRTIPGTRSYHQFKTESIDTITFKRTSEDVHITAIFSFSGIQSSQNDQQINIDAFKFG